MAQAQLFQGGSTTALTIAADTNATANTVPLRDQNGGLTNKQVVAQTLLTTNGQFQGQLVAQSASFTAGAATDYLCDATGGAIVVTMPTPSANTGVIYTIIKKDSSGNTVSATGSVLGTASISSQYGKLRLISDGTNWYSA